MMESEMDNLAEKIDRILIRARDSIRDGCLEQSEYAEGRDAAKRDADEAFDEARGLIADLLHNSKEPGTLTPPAR
jgi:hypothetical protein